MLLLAGRLLSREIDRPWVGHQDFNGALWSNVARNYNRYGFVGTKFGQVDNYGSLTPGTFSYYIHHPPLLPVLVAFSFRLFGESEASARYVPIAFSLGALVFVFLISRHFWGTIGAAVATAALVATPHFLYFGRMVNHEPLTFFFMMGAAYFYALWRDSASRLSYALFVAFLIGGGLSGWPMYIFMGSVFILDIILEKRVRKEVLVAPLLAILLFTLFVAHVSLLKGTENAFSDLLNILKMRTGQAPDTGGENFNWTEVPARVSYWLRLEFTWPLLFLSLLGFALALLFKNQRSQGFLGLTIALFAVSVIHVVIFAHGAWYHDYWTYYFLAPFALSTSFWGSFAFPRKWMNYAALAVGIALLGALAYVGSSTTNYLYEFSLDYRPKMVGDAVRESTTTGTIVLTDLPYFDPQGNYYADRKVVVGVDTIEKLKGELGRYQNKSIVFLEIGALSQLGTYLLSRYDSKILPSAGARIFVLSQG